jgi:hypothetical protein
VDPVPDPLLLRKSGSAGNLTRDLWVSNQELWQPDHRGGPPCVVTVLNIYIDNMVALVVWYYNTANMLCDRFKWKQSLCSCLAVEQIFIPSPSYFIAAFCNGIGIWCIVDCLLAILKHFKHVSSFFDRMLVLWCIHKTWQKIWVGCLKKYLEFAQSIVCKIMTFV